MAKIKVKTPVVELDGDEMTRIIWDFIKQKLILPYLDIDLKYYDLSMQSRDATNDQITVDSAKAIQEYGVGVKCATITPDEARVEEFKPQTDVALARTARSATFWAARCSASPLSAQNVPRLVPGWTQPIVIGRHAFGDQYRATDFAVPGPGKLTMRFEPATAARLIEREVFQFPKSRASRMAMYNLDESIRGLRARLPELWPAAELPGLSVDQEHDPEGL